MPIVAKSFEETLEVVRQWQSNGLSVVLTQGVFDCLHEGHRAYLYKASTFGNRLVVGVDSDEKARMRKGVSRPFESYQARVEKISTLPWVALIFQKQEMVTRWHYIKLIQPDILVISLGAYTESEQEMLSGLVRRLVSLPRTPNISTTHLADTRIKE